MKYSITLLFLIFFSLSASGQDGAYTIGKASFSSELYDEFSPVYYRNGIVFCTNRGQGVTNYSDGQNKSPFKINYIDTTGKVKWQDAQLLSKDLTTRLNEGPATFSRNGDTIYFSRNLNVDPKTSKLLGIRNKLGIFSAALLDGEWINVREFRHNIEWYNVTTPFLSPDGKRLYFSSDQQGGYGGTDIYYSQWKNGYWDTPINPGPVINTKSNEGYPFINEAGDLFFSSNGHKGLGGMDIFVTKQGKSGWHVPVGLEAPVNSEKDDFGILTDRFANEGYFSSNRGKTVDIYQFKSNKFHFWFPETQRDNQYCFTASDSGSILVDTLRLQYVWDFGDGSKMNGPRATHCYQSPGSYSINLNLLDRRTGKVFFNKLKYEIDITNTDQPFINSPDIAKKGETVEFDGLQSNCPGYTITAYYWEFGDGTYSFGERANHIYYESGNYEVRLGLMLKSQADGGIMKRVVSRKIRVLEVVQENASDLSGNAKQNISDIRSNENIKVKGHYSAESELQKESEFQIVILSAPAKVPLTSTLFRKVPSKYNVKEVFDEESGFYNYVVDQQLELMFTYPAYSEMISAGYNDTRVSLQVLKDQAEKELHNLKVKYGVLSDSYFDTGNKLVTNGILMLNQIATLMAKYPHISIEIGVHTDNQGNTEGSQWLTQTRAKMMLDYLVGSGMDSKRLKAIGFGGTRPVAPTSSESDRRLNRRVEFTISTP